MVIGKIKIRINIINSARDLARMKGECDRKCAEFGSCQGGASPVNGPDHSGRPP